MSNLKNYLLTLMFLLSLACGNREVSSSCEDWKIAAAAYQRCYPQAYPPVENGGDVACISEEKFADMSVFDPLFLDINTIGKCADYLEDMQNDCGYWEKQSGHTVSESRARVRHCTTDIVKTWWPPTSGD
jgi:hypothetical protein